MARDGAAGGPRRRRRSARDRRRHARRVRAQGRRVAARPPGAPRLADRAAEPHAVPRPPRARPSPRRAPPRRRRGPPPGGVAVLFVDLDRFKLINDSFGHAAGDRLLCDVAERLRHALRPADTIARFGGDELTVLCEDLDGEAGARAVAHRIAQLFEEPFSVEDGEAFLQASIGIALAGDCATPEDLIRDGDAAMYRAKDRGRSRVEVFDEAMRRDARERVATESALRRAIARDELLIHVQPVVGIADERIEGFEALVRWEHPERGLVPPGAFIPLAEETGLIVPIGAWVLSEACATLRRIIDETGMASLQVSVNVSPRQLQQPDFVAQVRAALDANGLKPSRLVVEITESAIMEAGAAAILRALKDIGVRLAMDDFGTGYSSLAHLRRFPLDVIKVDRSFVAGLGDGQGSSIAGAIISLAHALGLRTVAEGIEDEEQRRAVLALGCDVGQGFHFARPMPVDDLTRLLAASN